MSGSKVHGALGVAFYWMTIPLLIVYIRRSSRVRLLVTQGDSVLVVRPWHGNGKWALPGGGLHKRESARAGALRELREEAGVVLSPSSLTSLGTFLYTQHKLNFHYELFTAHMQQIVPLRRQRGEIVEAAWVPKALLNAQTANQDVVSSLAASRSGR